MRGDESSHKHHCYHIHKLSLNRITKTMLWPIIDLYYNTIMRSLTFQTKTFTWKLFKTTKQGFPVFLLVNRNCRVLLSEANSPLLGIWLPSNGLFASLNKTRQILLSNRNTGNPCFVVLNNFHVNKTMCYNRNNPLALVFCWIRLHPRAKALGFCLIQQNTRARWLFLKLKMYVLYFLVDAHKHYYISRYLSIEKRTK